MRIQLRRFGLIAALASAPVAGCASAHAGGEALSSEILSELPANAPPGECYAKVVVPGEPVAQPPVMQGAVWVMTPGRPGMPGPIWCLVPTGPIAQAPIESPARYGWIRVLCDSEATPERIGHVQHALHDRGYYRGEASGHYDRATAEAVSRFQAGAHINHGGYLSEETVEALDQGQPTYGPPPPPQAPGYGYAQAYGYPAGPAYYPQPGPAPCNCAPAFAPPAYYAPAYPPQPQPCCAAPPSYGYGGGYGFGTPTPAYAAASASAYAGGGYASAHASASATVQNGWLVWGGKSGF